MRYAKYKWKGVNKDGERVSGSVEASNSNQVRASLRGLGYYPIKISREVTSFTFLNRKVSLKEWIIFVSKLSIMLEAGIPLLKSLEIIAGTQSADRLGKEWLRLKEKVAEGYQLSEALNFTETPPPLFLIAMVSAGEQTGNLARSLARVAVELEKTDKFRRKMIETLTYPLLLVFAVIVVIWGLRYWVLPIYENLYSSFDAQLPFLTKVILISGRQLPFVGLVFAVIIIAILIYTFAISPRTWRLELERKFLRVPLVGRLYLLGEMVNLSRLLGEMLEAGVPLLEALNLVLRTSKSEIVKSLLQNLLAGVNQGKRLVTILRGFKEFPLQASEMLAVGEESGRIGFMFTQVADLMKQELEQKFDSITRMLGPILTVGLACLIGLVAIGVLLPLFEATTFYY